MWKLFRSLFLLSLPPLATAQCLIYAITISQHAPWPVTWILILPGAAIVGGIAGLPAMELIFKTHFPRHHFPIFMMTIFPPIFIVWLIGMNTIIRPILRG